MEKSKFKPNGFALVPFLIFVVVYLGIGVTLVAKGILWDFTALRALLP